MKNIKIILTGLIASMLLINSSSLVKAQEVEEISQEQEQTIEWTCDSYGQCSATTSQNQKMYATRRLQDGRWVYAHTPAETAVDINSIAFMAGIITTGAGATFLKLASKKA